MTITDNKCDVCGVNKSIGVACTMMPMSVAYCQKCAELGAQPNVVFECWFDDIGTDYSKMVEGLADHVVTFKNGKYVTYREYADAKINESKANGS